GSEINGTEAPLTGQNLSHYEILAKLGEGGMGIVYRAFDTQLLRPVALKVLSPAALADPESNTRLLREARAASALNHPHIAHVYEVGEAGGVRFIVMEHIEGRTLATDDSRGSAGFRSRARLHSAGGRCYGRSARARHHSSGSQAIQHHDYSAETVEDSGLRTGQGASAATGRAAGLRRSLTFQTGPCHRHHALHESGASPRS